MTQYEAANKFIDELKELLTTIKENATQEEKDVAYSRLLNLKKQTTL